MAISPARFRKFCRFEKRGGRRINFSVSKVYPESQKPKREDDGSLLRSLRAIKISPYCSDVLVKLRGVGLSGKYK
jgi:hypothetical protein